MENTKCIHCGKEFEKKSYQQKFCCKTCKENYWKKKDILMDTIASITKNTPNDWKEVSRKGLTMEMLVRAKKAAIIVWIV